MGNAESLAATVFGSDFYMDIGIVFNVFYYPDCCLSESKPGIRFLPTPEIRCFLT